MTHADFTANGFYYNNGQEVLTLPMEDSDVVLRHYENGTHTFYKLVYRSAEDDVFLEKYGVDGKIEEDPAQMKDFLHNCYPTTEEERRTMTFRPF